jgi:hypothetical protein
MKTMRKIASLNVKGTFTKREIDKVVKEVKYMREASKINSSPKVAVHIRNK